MNEQNITKKVTLKPSDLPGQPFVMDRKTGRKEAVTPRQIIRNRQGQPIFLESSIDAGAIAAAASKLTGKKIRVGFFFAPQTPEIVTEIGFVSDKNGGGLPYIELAAIEAMVFFCREQRAKEKARLKQKRPLTA